jgi:single-stranded-DNA-specific exonuclease
MRWKILNKSKTKDVLKILLENRGLKSDSQKREFLRPLKPEKLTAQKVGISSAELKKAITRIKKAAKKKEKVVVYGDYDTDGVCATAIVWEALHRLGLKAMPFIPMREQGYGMKVEKLEELAKEGVKLVITVDQGIVALSQAKKAHELGLDLIITDHHVLGQKKPKALAIIHTTKLSGAGVAWVLAQKLGGKDNLDLAAIATVTDIVPLLGPSRSLVKFGLMAVAKTKRIGLKSLFQAAGLSSEKLDTYEIGYIIGPRLNAAGRMEDPLDSLRLICTSDQKRAQELAQKLDQRNRERQLLTQQTFLHARDSWLKTDGRSQLIFVAHETYAEGIVGLVASKLAEEFCRPAVVVAQQKDWSKASARSVNGFNMVEAVRACAELLDSHGGHAKAAGFTIATSKIEAVRVKLLALAENQLAPKPLIKQIIADCELPWEKISEDLYQQLQTLSPFGEANPPPVFVSRQVKVLEARLVGANSQHLKLKLASPNSSLVWEAIGFSLGNFYPQLSPDKLIDIVYSLTLDFWNGEKKLLLKLKDLKFNP